MSYDFNNAWQQFCELHNRGVSNRDALRMILDSLFSQLRSMPSSSSVPLPHSSVSEIDVDDSEALQFIENQLFDTNEIDPLLPTADHVVDLNQGMHSHLYFDAMLPALGFVNGLKTRFWYMYSVVAVCCI